ncbi:MAG: ferric reductase-like transmembrane domain-containing protein [Actinomycetota bacterium]|nr:ferric reductase-like transmembrane domain-containing protein [Actinomycetota bacterium]
MTTWILLRAAGIGSYLMLFLSVAWGLIATTSLVTKRISKQAANTFHALTASTGLALLGLHVGLLLIDGFMPFSLVAVTVPMAAEYRPVAITAGVVAMYAVVIVIVSSWVRKRIGTAWWRRLHLLAVPTFALTLLHGVFAGTDSERPWMFTIYALTGLSVVFLTLVRALTSGYRPPRPVAPVRNRAEEPAARA